MIKDLEGTGLLIHHWDTDGISSAKILLEEIGDKIIENKTPILGNYFLTQDELKAYCKFDFVIVADMNLPKENILKLAENAEVLIFDHHLGPQIKEVFHYNPVIKGEDSDIYPSASWIVNDYFKRDVNLYALLGVVGDHEQKIKNNIKFNKIIEKFCFENNLSFEDLHKMVYLLDSNYKLGDKKAVEDAPRILLKHDSADFIMRNKKWNENLKKLDSETEKQLSMPNKEINDVIFKKIDTSYNIISTITRKVAWSTGKNTIVVNTGYFDDKNQLYVRSNKNVEPLIRRGKQLGFKCGGKKEVLGAILPKDVTNSFVEEIINFLK